MRTEQNMNINQWEDLCEGTYPSGNRIMPHEEEHLDFGAAMEALAREASPSERGGDEHGAH